MWIFFYSVWCMCTQLIVELLVEHGADVEARDVECRTPLHVIAANNALDSCQCLLPSIDDVNIVDQSQRTALHHAAYHGHTQVHK